MSPRLGQRVHTMPVDQGIGGRGQTVHIADVGQGIGGRGQTVHIFSPCDCTTIVTTYGVRSPSINHGGDPDYFDIHNGWRINASYNPSFGPWEVHSQFVGTFPRWFWQNTLGDTAFEQREWLFLGLCVKRAKIEFDPLVGMSGSGTSPIRVDVFADFRSPDFVGPGPGTPGEPVLMDHSSIDDVVPLFTVDSGDWIDVNFRNLWISPSAITPGTPGEVIFTGFVAGDPETPPTEPYLITVETCAPLT